MRVVSSILLQARGRAKGIHKSQLRYIRAVVLVAIVGASLGAVAVGVAYRWRPTLTLEMDRSLPRRFASGLYDGERDGQTTFTWTSQRADIKLADLSRRMSWICSIRLRGARSDPATQPSVTLAADGVVAATVNATNEFQDVPVVLPPRSSSGAVVTITSSSTIVPGPSDPRQLGVQLDRVSCAPQDGRPWPPSATIVYAALIGAIFGAAFVLAGLPIRLALATVTTLAALQALPLSAGPAPYVPFAEMVIWFAIWICIGAVALVTVFDRCRPVALESTARMAIALSASVLYLKILGLVHPSKLVIDAVFHAHRLEWVMSGRYFFTQPMPGGVTFPYAIGLYVFAAPWTVLTRDYVTLLRVIACAAQVTAGALLYPVIVKGWNDRAAALMAVVLFNLVPLPYGLLGNANLTNTFGEAVAVAAVASASLVSGGVLPFALFFGVTALAFLSHVSTFANLGVTLAVLVVGYRVLGGPSLQRLAWPIGLLTLGAATLAVILYYGHFGEVYKTALRVRAATPAAVSQTDVAPVPVPASSQGPSLGTRVTNAIGSAVGMIGWPILLPAVVGLWRSIVDRSRDRATLAAMAWAVSCAVFLGVAVMRVDAPFQRYAAEFFGRVLLATFPAAVVLAARGAAWLWNHGATGRIVSALLMLWAVVLGTPHWIVWFH